MSFSSYTLTYGDTPGNYDTDIVNIIWLVPVGTTWFTTRIGATTFGSELKLYKYSGSEKTFANPTGYIPIALNLASQAGGSVAYSDGIYTNLSVGGFVYGGTAYGSVQYQVIMGNSDSPKAAGQTGLETYDRKMFGVLYIKS